MYLFSKLQFLLQIFSLGKTVIKIFASQVGDVALKASAHCWHVVQAGVVVELTQEFFIWNIAQGGATMREKSLARSNQS